MDVDKLFEMTAFYKGVLDQMGIAPKSCDRSSTSVSREDKLAHCRRMLDKLPKHIAQGRLEKAQRWIAFIQGVLYALDITTITELKDTSRPITG